MAFQLLFPTPFLHEKAEGEIFDAIQKEILDCVNKIKEDDDYESLSDVSDMAMNRREEFTTIQDNHVIKKYNLSNFLNFVRGYAEKYIETCDWAYLTDLGKKRAAKIMMTDSWINIQKNETQYSHIHAHHQLSGVYYHTIKENMGGVTFQNPNPHMSFMQFPEGPLSPNSITLQPEEGTLILFPSWLHHGTQRNVTDDERISLSFNINIF